MLDGLLQADLREGLEEKYPFLKAPFGKPSEKQLEDLEADLSKIPPDGFLDLRSGFPGVADVETQTLINHFINRNKLYDAISDYTTQDKKLEKFLETYFAITSTEERKKCLEDFKAMAPGNARALVELVENDISRNNFQKLQGIDKTQRTELFEACFIDDHTHGTATLASMLIEANSTKPGSVDGEFVLQVLNGDFDDSIEILKEMRKKPSAAKEMDEILQAGLQADLTARFDCLNNTGDDFEDLRQELDKNYDLTKFTPTPKNL